MPVENIAGKAEFLYKGAVPFALQYCERFQTKSVSGQYNERQQRWQGNSDIGAALTLTMTATPGDRDQDQD